MPSRMRRGAESSIFEILSGITILSTRPRASGFAPENRHPKQDCFAAASLGALQQAKPRRLQPSSGSGSHRIATRSPPRGVYSKQLAVALPSLLEDVMEHKTREEICDVADILPSSLQTRPLSKLERLEL